MMMLQLLMMTLNESVTMVPDRKVAVKEHLRTMIAVVVVVAAAVVVGVDDDADDDVDDDEDKDCPSE